jgi:hypothetical protein
MTNYVYYVYKTINKHNSKYYIGVHRTNNINDGYMGCGHYRGRKLRENLDTRLYRAFRKYGDDAFTTEVLYIFENEIDAYNKEKELIDIKDKNCYNDKPGGIGGFHPDTNKGRVFTESERKKMSEAAKIRSKRILLQTDILKEHVKNRTGKTYAEIYGEEKGKEVSLKRSKSLTGRKLSDEHKRKMSINRKGKDCGKCKGRVQVWNNITKKGMRISRDILQAGLKEGSIIEQLFVKDKFHKFKFSKIK